MNRETRFRVSPGPAPRGAIAVPGDKSMTHRALLLGALAEGETLAAGPNRGADCRATAAALRRLGVPIEESAEGFLVRGSGGDLREAESPLDCGNSGTGARLLAGLLAAEAFPSTIDGDASLRRRPMRRVVEPLRAMGARIDGPDGGARLPLTIRGGSLRGIVHRTEVASAQVKTAVLLAGLRASGRTTVVEPSLSRDHTERMIAYLGGRVEREGLRTTVEGGTRLRGARIEVGGDPSSAAFFVTAGLVVPGGEVVAEGIVDNPTRTAFLDVLERMGGRIERERAETIGPEGRIHVRARARALCGTVIEGDEVPRLIDEIPILAVAGALAEGVFEVRDAAELRVKESDRIRLVVTMLRAFGVEAEERADGFVVRGGGALRGARVASGGDHRIAMAAAIAGLAARGETIVEETACVATSLPEFLALAADLGLGEALAEEEM
ncbi:MAG: 3-phosphoshikimate 1-carboxyvinyltransferase [Candidatus Eisenbacteria bacterium]|nr:3-phosphoshikimate 1-carboxyvinyltransferase [Candidatus Eisenbacteria bacterium]